MNITAKIISLAAYRNRPRTIRLRAARGRTAMALAGATIIRLAPAATARKR